MGEPVNCQPLQEAVVCNVTWLGFLLVDTWCDFHQHHAISVLVITSTTAIITITTCGSIGTMSVWLHLHLSTAQLRPVWSLDTNQVFRLTFDTVASLSEKSIFLAHDAFIERIVALLPWCSSVCLSICLGRSCIVIVRCTSARIEVYGC